MPATEPGPGGSSDVVDAMPDTSADGRTHTETANSLFRAKALDQLDVAADVDNQLPLVSRRDWLLLVGAALIVLAFGMWAALTPALKTVSGDGRVVASSGLLAITSPVGGFVSNVSAETGTTVGSGDQVAALATQTGSVPVRSVVSGTIWQVVATVGSAVEQGQIIATVLPDSSANTALVVVTDEGAEEIRPGMQVTSGAATVGTVASVAPPLPAVDVMERTGVTVAEQQLASIVVVDLDEPAQPGTSATFTIVLSSDTVLERLIPR